jgi:hypothetical protein
LAPQMPSFAASLAFMDQYRGAGAQWAQYWNPKKKTYGLTGIPAFFWKVIEIYRNQEVKTCSLRTWTKTELALAPRPSLFKEYGGQRTVAFRGFSWLFVTPQVTIHRIWRPCGRSCHALTQRPGTERFRDFRGLDDANVDDGTSSSSSINDMLFKITIIIMWKTWALWSFLWWSFLL